VKEKDINSAIMKNNSHRKKKGKIAGDSHGKEWCEFQC
jgi:hypothetical protein